MHPDEAAWLRAESLLSAAEELAPGLTRGEVVAWHRRPPTPPGARFTPGIAASPHSVMHLYQRAGPARPAPGVLFVHGGGWSSGSPFVHIRRCAELAARGWVAATTSYRLAGQARWPAQLDDVRAARAWLVAHAGEIGLDPDRLALAGDSAGAHLALLDALTPAEALPRVPVVAVWYPVTDLRAPGAALAAAVELLLPGATRRQLDAASPLSHVVASDRLPSVLSMTGRDDTVVSYASVERFHAELARVGAAQQVVAWSGGHAFDWTPSLWSETFETAHRFLAARL